MYLSLLTSEEKNAFLELAITIASSDNDFSDHEKAMVQLYCNEMQIAYSDNIKVRPLAEILSALKECSERTKKIILYEVIGLVLVDGEVDSETNILNEMQKAFNISPDFTKECKNILQEYISFQEKVNALVLQ